MQGKITETANHTELLKMFLKHEQQIRRDDPALFWQLIDRLTSTQPTNGPGISGAFFSLFGFLTLPVS